MKLRWVLALLLVLNFSYLVWGLYRAQLPDGGRETTPLQRASGVSDIRLIDSLADSPPGWGSTGLDDGPDGGPETGPDNGGVPGSEVPPR